MLIKFIATDGFIFDWERQFLMGGVTTDEVGLIDPMVE